MSEKSQNHQFRDCLARFGHIHRIENVAGVGTPDTNVCFNGHEHWIEAKNLDRWPSRQDTPVRLKHHFAPEQRIWFRRRLQALGRPLLYLRIESTEEYFFFDGKMAVEHVDVPNGLTRDEMIRCSLFYAKVGEFPTIPILGFLTTPESYRRFLVR